MANQRVSIPQLYGGVSTQPPVSRRQNQVETADNVYFEVRDCASKRPGATYEFTPDGLTDGVSYRFHVIDRDEEEKYLVIFGQSTVKIWDTDGVEAVITFDQEHGTAGDAQAYIDYDDATANYLRMTTVADYTIMVNTKRPTGYLTSPAFNIAGTHRDYGVLSSNSPESGTYHKTNEDDLAYPAGYFEYDLTEGGGGTFATYKGPSVTGTSYGVPTGYYDDADKNPGGFKVGFTRFAITLTGATCVAGVLAVASGDPFADYTHQPGDKIHITSDTPQWVSVISKTDDNTLVVTSGVLPESGNAADGIGIEIDIATLDMRDAKMDDMYDVAAQFQNALQTGGATDGIISWTYTGTDAGYFTITSPYRGDGLIVSHPTTPSSGYDWTTSQNPFDGNGVSTDGTGTPTTAMLPVSERWKRVPPPNQPKALFDPTTMPLQITRTTTSPLTFDISTIDWTARYTGTTDTNPLPNIVDKGLTISDVSFYRNRLVLGGGEYVMLGQASDAFNFFIDNAYNIVDSDPIESSLSTGRVTVVDFMVPFRKTLVIFTKAGQQFELTAPEALTATTAAITPSTQYDTMPSVRPKQLSSQLYFACSEGSSAQIREYGYDFTAATSVAAEITAHVQGYLPLSLKTIDTCANSESIYAVGYNTNSVYKYRMYWNGNEKLASAWSRLVFDEDYSIRDIAVIGTNVWMLVEIGTDFHVMRLTTAQEPEATGMPYMPHMDNRQLLTGTASVTSSQDIVLACDTVRFGSGSFGSGPFGGTL